MARRRKYEVPGVEQAMQRFKADVMKQEGYTVNPERPDDVKYEVAKEIGIPLKQGNNGDLTTEEAGQIGGKIGGSMVREMVRMAQERMSKKDE